MSARREIVVLTRPGCIFCAQVLDILREAKVPFTTREVEDRAEQDALVAQYRALSFPIVLADGNYVGGFTHIVKLHADGRLAHLSSGERSTPPGAAPRPSSDSTTAPSARAGSLAGYAAFGEYLRKNRKPLDR